MTASCHDHGIVCSTCSMFLCDVVYTMLILLVLCSQYDIVVQHVYSMVAVGLPHADKYLVTVVAACSKYGCSMTLFAVWLQYTFIIFCITCMRSVYL